MENVEAGSCGNISDGWDVMKVAEIIWWLVTVVVTEVVVSCGGKRILSLVVKVGSP